MTVLSPNRLIARVAGIIFLADQLTKWAVLKYLNYADEKIIVIFPRLRGGSILRG